MFFDKILNRGQTHQSIVSTVEVADGKVVKQFSWTRRGNGGLVNEPQDLVGTDAENLPAGYMPRLHERR